MKSIQCSSVSMPARPAPVSLFCLLPSHPRPSASAVSTSRIHAHLPLVFTCDHSAISACRKLVQGSLCLLSVWPETSINTTHAAGNSDLIT